MPILEKVRQKAKADLNKIVLPEGEEDRILRAACKVEREGLAKPVLLGNEDRIRAKARELSLKLGAIEVVDPQASSNLEQFIEKFYELRKHKGITIQQAREIFFKNPVYSAAMMVREGLAHGFLAGASFTTRDVARAAIHCIGVDKKVGVVSSSFIMILPNREFGEEGVFLFADCGIVPEPSPQQLAKIALCTAQFMNQLLGCRPRVAMLSYSTKGSGKGPAVEKVVQATRLIQQEAPQLLVEGELQADTAIAPEVARIKDPQGVLSGRANVLIFPDLNSGNIAYKLVQRLTGAKALGPFLQGLNKPCSDLSRGCSVEELVDIIAITAVRNHNPKSETQQFSY